MKTASTAFVAAFVVGAAATPIVREVARRYGALDHVLTSRKVHGRPVPRLGGIAIVFAFYAPLIALFFTSSDVGKQFYADSEKAIGLFAGGLAIALLGVFDDLRGANAKQKFAVQFAVAGFMYWIGFRVDHISNPFGPPVDLGWLGVPFTLVWIAGVINAMNLIDGLDGLAGGVALIAIATTLAFAASKGDALMVLFTASLAGAVLGFLFYNFNPASIFMGDSGSMFLGFVLASTSIQTSYKSSTAVAIVVPIIALGVPIADTLLAMVRRAMRGVPMFTADRGHIHHRLLDHGFTHRQTVLVLYGASIVLGGGALLLAFANATEATYVLTALSAAAYLGLRKLGFFSVANVHAVLQDRRRNLGIRRELRHIAQTLSAAQGLETVWVAVRMAGQTVGASAVALHLADDLLAHDLAFSSGFDEAGVDLFRARYGVVSERPGGPAIEFGWADGRASVDRDTEIAIEVVCGHVSAALERIESPAWAGRARVVAVSNSRR